MHMHAAHIQISSPLQAPITLMGNSVRQHCVALAGGRSSHLQVWARQLLPICVTPHNLGAEPSAAVCCSGTIHPPNYLADAADARLR